MWASDKGHAAIVQVLLTKPGLDVNLLDNVRYCDCYY